MRNELPRRLVLLAVAFCAMSGCHPEAQPTFVTNDAAVPVTIAYGMERLKIDAGRWSRCRLEEYPPRVTSDHVSSGNWGSANWRAVDASKIDLERCETRFVLAPGETAWIESNGACDDYPKYRDNPGWKPTVSSFSVRSPAGSAEFTGFETAKVFKREWGGACRYKFR